MKYKSISLNGTDNYQYSLVKYEDKYKYILDTVDGIDIDLMDAVITCPSIYSEDSDHQSYMLVKDDNIGVGAVYIGTSCDEKDLELKLQLDESKFANEIEMYKLINQLIDSLGLYCYERKNIYIKLVNKIDLSKYNGLKYKREYLLPNIATYICSNEKYNTLIPLLLREIKSCEDTLVSWKQTWWQDIEYRALCDLNSVFDGDFLVNRDIPLDETFNKVESVKWSGINSNTSKREITFNIDGDVSFSKMPKKSDGIKYTINYNMLRDGFSCKRYFHSELNSCSVSVEENKKHTKINAFNVEVIKSNGKIIKKITSNVDVTKFKEKGTKKNNL